MGLRSSEEASVVGAKSGKESVAGRKAREMTGDGEGGAQIFSVFWTPERTSAFAPREARAAGTRSGSHASRISWQVQVQVGCGARAGAGRPGRPAGGEGGLSRPVTVPEVRGSQAELAGRDAGPKRSVEGRREDGTLGLALPQMEKGKVVG